VKGEWSMVKSERRKLVWQEAGESLKLGDEDLSG